MGKFKNTGLRVKEDIDEVYKSYPLTVYQKVKAFHEGAGLPVGTSEFSDDRVEFRDALIDEEYKEYETARNYSDKVKMLDAICDLVYVLVGTCVEFGWDFDEAFRRVHSSNMTKFSADNVKLREDGKLLKGDDFVPPYLEDLV